MQEEIWKNTEFDGYMVSNLGRVKSLDRWLPPDKMHPKGQFFKGKILSTKQTNHEYESVMVSKTKRVYIHRLVAQAFIPNPDNKRDVNHLNGNKKDNRVENLEWTTHKENMQHAKNILGLLSNKEKAKKVLCVELKKKFNSMCEASRFLGDNTQKGGGIGMARKTGYKAKGYHWKLIS